MKAANYLRPGKIEMCADATRPKIGPEDVLIAVRACGICGSDLHMYRNDSLREVLVTRTPEGYDVPGHEFAGVIVQTGDAVVDFAVGERVVGIPSSGGGMGQFCRIPVNPFQLVRIPDEVSFEEAATTEPLADSLQMVRKAQIQPGENVLIIGVGIIGLGVIQAIQARGAKPGRIIAVDVVPARLDKARELGATHVVNPAETDVFEAVAAICGRTDGYQGPHANIAVVFDCAGYIAHLNRPAPLETALGLIQPNTGRIICFGAYEGKVTIDLEHLINKQPTIMGSLGYASEELVEALELMRSGKVDRRTLLSHRFPLDQIQEAFDAQTRPDAVKVIVEIPQD